MNGILKLCDLFKDGKTNLRDVMMKTIKIDC